MFYVSKVSPILFALALLNLSLSLILKLVDGLSFLIVLTFGFIGTTLIGAIYQIVPNSQNRKLPLPQMSYILSGILYVSFILFYLGLFTIASGLLLLCWGAFFVHVLSGIRNWMPITVRFLGVSAFYLFLASLFLFLNLISNIVPFQLAVHTLTVGAMLNAVYGVELAWIPMLLMETLNIRKARAFFWSKQVSTLLLLVSFYLLNYRAIAVASLVELGVSLYFLYLIYSLFKNRKTPVPIPYVVRIFLVALPFLPVGLLVGGFLASHPELIGKALNLHVDLLVYGFTAFTVFGGMVHLLPRIVWNWKIASSKMGSLIGINELVEEKGFPRFLELSLLAFAIYLYLDLSFYPLEKLSPLPYLFIVGFFIKLTFLRIFKKLREVKDGGEKA